jgi:UrcA family protein
MNLRILSWNRLLTLLASLRSAAACVPAFAAERVNGQPGTTVKFADLNLNTDAGSCELLDRPSRAADRVCRESVRVRSSLDGFGYRRTYLLCHRDTLSVAVVLVLQPAVSADE